MPCVGGDCQAFSWPIKFAWTPDTTFKITTFDSQFERLPRIVDSANKDLAPEDVDFKIGKTEGKED